jgi:hypothetical protein
MIHESLKEAKEDPSILDAKMDKCSDSIQSISTALASSNTTIFQLYRAGQFYW